MRDSTGANAAGWVVIVVVMAVCKVWPGPFLAVVGTIAGIAAAAFTVYWAVGRRRYRREVAQDAAAAAERAATERAWKVASSDNYPLQRTPPDAAAAPHVYN